MRQVRSTVATAYLTVGNTCVDDNVTQYLVTDVLPAVRGTVCHPERSPLDPLGVTSPHCDRTMAAAVATQERTLMTDPIERRTPSHPDRASEGTLPFDAKDPQRASRRSSRCGHRRSTECAGHLARRRRLRRV